MIETVQDFLIKLSIKPLMQLLEISIFSLDNYLVSKVIIEKSRGEGSLMEQDTIENVS